jgi:hypothetical protein
MTLLRHRLPISESYDSAIFEAVSIQIVLGLVSLMILDGGTIARICGIALVAFWSGVAVLIFRHPASPSMMYLQVIRFGYFPVVVIAFLLVQWIWHLRGLQ